MSTQETPIEKVYTYETKNKTGKVVTKRVVRKYTNKKDTSNTLQNKAHKEALEQNIKDNLNLILDIPDRKRISYIKKNCLPENVTASYNTVKTIWIKVYSDSLTNAEETE